MFQSSSCPTSVRGRRSDCLAEHWRCRPQGFHGGERHADAGGEQFLGFGKQPIGTLGTLRELLAIEPGKQRAILLASEVENPKQAGLGAPDITIRRNAYGRQVDSSIREGQFLNKPIEMVFIRAPKIERIGDGIAVIATEGSDSVMVRKGKTLAATFHPELSDDPRIHQYFLDMVENGSGRL